MLNSLPQMLEYKLGGLTKNSRSYFVSSELLSYHYVHLMVLMYSSIVISSVNPVITAYSVNTSFIDCSYSVWVFCN